MLKEPCLPQGFAELKEKLLKRFSEAQYSGSTMESYLRSLSRLENYMKNIGAITYSVEIGKAFINEKTKTGGIDLKSLKSTVRRMNEMIGMTSANTRETQDAPENSSCYTEQLNDYADYLKLRGIRTSSIRM